MSQTMMVLIALGVIVLLIVAACVIAAIVYKVKYSKLENELQGSVVDGGDTTEMSRLFAEKYKSEGSTGMTFDEFNS